MKLLRLKLTDSQPFRSLRPGFEYHFRSPLELEEELKTEECIAPFVCAGPNGSGKSNLLELLAAIFFQLETHRVWRNLPPTYVHDEEFNPDGIKDTDGIPDAYELEYLITLPKPSSKFQHVRITKESGVAPSIEVLSRQDNDQSIWEKSEGENIDFLLPEHIVGYSSGENEILSLPFFKMRFIQYDEYWNSLKNQLAFPGRPETRLTYLDNSFSQAILLCNLIYEEANDDKVKKTLEYQRRLESFCGEVGLQELKEFRIIIKRHVEVSTSRIAELGNEHPALRGEDTPNEIKITDRLEIDEELEYQGPQEQRGRQDRLDRIINRLKRCATCHYTDSETDTLYLDYFVNEETRNAFSDNFDFEVNKSPIALFQAFQVLLSLNLYSVSDKLKSELYKSDSYYVSETVPTLASDQRIMRFKFVKFTKAGCDEAVSLKSLSDGEHQLLHSLGLCLLFKNTNSLFLLDEPETHFNPDWRASFITRLRNCLGDSDTHEMLITTHSPFLISDSKPKHVLVFENEDGQVQIEHPKYNTFGASVNKITLSTFDKRETIGGQAQLVLDELRKRFEGSQFTAVESPQELIAEIHRRIGDSVERTLLIKSILDDIEEA